MIAGLIEAMQEAVWLVSAQTLRVVAVNEAAARLAGTRREALIGRAVTELASTPEDLAFWADADSMRDDRLLSETLLRRADGSTVAVTRRVSLAAIDGRRCFVVSLQDRGGAERRAREREAQLGLLQATLESLADGVLVTDLAGRVQQFNRRFAELWQMPLALLYRPDDATVHAFMRRAVADGGAAPRLDAVHAGAIDTRLVGLADAGDGTPGPADGVLRLHGGRCLEQRVRLQQSRGEPIGRVLQYREVSGARAAIAA